LSTSAGAARFDGEVVLWNEITVDRRIAQILPRLADEVFIGVDPHEPLDGRIRGLGR
jgi:hypothetical protein